MKTLTNRITWSDIALLCALFGFEVEQRALRSAVLVNREGAFPRRIVATLKPHGWQADFS